MNWILLAVALTGLAGIRPRRGRDPLDQSQTTAINGFFVLLVFLRHAAENITWQPGDEVFRYVNSRLGQLIVVPFLFYSGYGVMCSILSKGRRYLQQLPRKRMLKVWYHFALAVGLYWLLSLYLGKDYPPDRVLLAFTGWKAIGNSNWYIFCTLSMYLATWVGFRLFPESKGKAVLTVWGLAIVYVLLLRQDHGDWWYNTALLYPAGMTFGLYRRQLDRFINGKLWLRLAMAVLLAGIFILAFRHRKDSVWAYQVLGVSFMLVILAVTCLVRIRNPVLGWLGKYTFEIYILQRIPMTLLKGQVENRYLFLALGFGATVLLAVLFHRVLAWTDRLLYQKPRRNPAMKPNELMEMAKEAMTHAYIPYSGYKVGAALLCADGTVYCGCNIENASFTPTICAERTAFFKAVYDGHRDFVAIAVCGGKDGVITGAFPPCGVCRQVMREFCDDDFMVYMATSPDTLEGHTLAEVLPFSFSAKKHMN